MKRPVRQQTSRPLHPIAAGDMYGIKGIDHLCRPGQLRRVLAGSYPSGGSKLDPPLIRN
jgi:propionate CoA-transferase